MSWAEDNGIDTYDLEYDQPEPDWYNCSKERKLIPMNKWVTKEGKVVLISSMADSPLTNAIKQSLKAGNKHVGLLEEYFLRKENEN